MYYDCFFVLLCPRKSITIFQSACKKAAPRSLIVSVASVATSVAMPCRPAAKRLYGRRWSDKKSLFCFRIKKKKKGEMSEHVLGNSRKFPGGNRHQKSCNDRNYWLWVHLTIFRTRTLHSFSQIWGRCIWFFSDGAFFNFRYTPFSIMETIPTFYQTNLRLYACITVGCLVTLFAGLSVL